MKSVLAIAIFSMSAAAFSQVYVRPYTDRDGNYHEGHMRSAPNERRSDNYNAQNNQWGGTNPYTGQRGSQRDEYSNPPAFNQPRERRDNQDNQFQQPRGSRYTQPRY